MERYWAGLSVLDRLAEAGAELSSGEVGALLGTKSVKGIGAALSGSRNTLFGAGIRMEEAAVRRAAGGRSVWTAGPRIRQAIHVLGQERYRWRSSGGRDDVPLEGVRGGRTGVGPAGAEVAGQRLPDRRREGGTGRDPGRRWIRDRRRPARSDRGSLRRPDRAGSGRTGASGARWLWREWDLGARGIRLRRAPGAGRYRDWTVVDHDCLDRRGKLGRNAGLRWWMYGARWRRSVRKAGARSPGTQWITGGTPRWGPDSDM